MSRDLARLLQSLFWPAARAFRTPHWQPRADVYRHPGGWLVKFDLAGVRPEDITIEVQGPRLTLRGTRRDCSLEHGCRCYQMEISYSHFERSIQLPCDLEQAELSTEYRDGMLLVYIPTESAK
jgi:HSP20 family protein